LRILLVDDHPLFREALAATLADLCGCAEASISQCGSIAEAVTHIEAAPSDLLVLLDLQLPDNTGMIGLVELKARFPQLAIAIVSGTEDETTVARARACAASGYIPKSSPRRTLAAALQALLAGQPWFPAHAETAGSRLSGVQMQILNGIKRGLMNKQIAYELGLSEHTIKYHLTGIFRRLGCHTRAQLVSCVIDQPQAG
jgi:DNA-binding NarL/FixJ family response regulator